MLGDRASLVYLLWVTCTSRVGNSFACTSGLSPSPPRVAARGRSTRIPRFASPPLECAGAVCLLIITIYFRSFLWLECSSFAQRAPPVCQHHGRVMVGFGHCIGREFRQRVGAVRKCLGRRSHGRGGGDFAEASNIRNTCAGLFTFCGTRDAPVNAVDVGAARGDACDEKASTE